MTIKLSNHEVEDLMKSVARLLLDIPMTDNSTVRIPYGASSQTGSAPVHNPQNNVCYVYVQPTDDGYGKQHHISYKNGTDDHGGMTEVDEYTEEYAVIFSCYGPCSYDWSQLIRDGLYSNKIKGILGEKYIHLKTGSPLLTQTHDLMEVQWVKRCDVTATFYAYVRIERENVVQPIEQVNITLNVLNKSLSYGE